MRFNIGDINTHPIGEMCKACWNHFGKNMVLTTEWKEYKIMFSEIHQQPDWGSPRPLSLTPSKLVEIDWQIGPGHDLRHLGRRRRLPRLQVTVLGWRPLIRVEGRRALLG